MVLLDIPVFGRAFTVGVRRWIDHGQIIFFRAEFFVFDKGQCIEGNVLVPGSGESIGLHVLDRPVEIIPREIDGGGRVGAPRRRVNRKRARVGEQIQKSLSSRFFTNHLPCDPVVEEQSRVNVVR